MQRFQPARAVTGLGHPAVVAGAAGDQHGDTQPDADQAEDHAETQAEDDPGAPRPDAGVPPGIATGAEADADQGRRAAPVGRGHRRR